MDDTYDLCVLDVDVRHALDLIGSFELGERKTIQKSNLDLTDDAPPEHLKKNELFTPE